MLVELSLEAGWVANEVKEPTAVFTQLWVPVQVLFNPKREAGIEPVIAPWTQAVVGILVELSFEAGWVAVDKGGLVEVMLKLVNVWLKVVIFAPSAKLTSSLQVIIPLTLVVCKFSAPWATGYFRYNKSASAWVNWVVLNIQYELLKVATFGFGGRLTLII